MLDPALDTLLLPFADGSLAWPETGQILFLRGRYGAALETAPRERFVCRQSYLPFADLLSAGRFAIDGNPEPPRGPFPLSLVLPPRQRDAARGLLAEAVARVSPGGVVVAAGANNEGARSLEDDLAALAGPVKSRSKNKCRVFWTQIDPGAINRALLAEWQAAMAPRRIADGRFWSRPGLFAWDRIDAGSALLAQHLPDDLAGTGADLGCGFGYLSAEVLARTRAVTSLDLYDAEADALALAERNVRPLARGRNLEFFWHDVTTGLRQRYDFIVSNPPFHVQKADRTDLGQAFIVTASKHLKPGGRFYLVANQHLPYEASLSAHFATHRLLASADGYKIIEAWKAA